MLLLTDRTAPYLLFATLAAAEFVNNKSSQANGQAIHKRNAATKCCFIGLALYFIGRPFVYFLLHVTSASLFSLASLAFSLYQPASCIASKPASSVHHAPPHAPYTPLHTCKPCVTLPGKYACHFCSPSMPSNHGHRPLLHLCLTLEASMHSLCSTFSCLLCK